MEFGSDVVGAEPPVDGDARCVALALVGGDLALQCVRARGFLLLRQERLNALNAISAMLSQLACLGVW